MAKVRRSKIAGRLPRTPTGVLALVATGQDLGGPKAGHEFWRNHLRPLGFYHKAEVLEYPGEMPGDIGFFLNWKYDTFRAIPEK
jgi:hypothetical protein